MNEPPAPIFRVPDRPLWLMVATLVLLGIALYFWFAPSSPPGAPAAVETE